MTYYTQQDSPHTNVWGWTHILWSSQTSFLHLCYDQPITAPYFPKVGRQKSNMFEVSQQKSGPSKQSADIHDRRQVFVGQHCRPTISTDFVHRVSSALRRINTYQTSVAKYVVLMSLSTPDPKRPTGTSIKYCTCLTVDCRSTIIIIDNYRCSASHIWYARILLYWTGIARLVCRLGFRSKG